MIHEQASPTDEHSRREREARATVRQAQAAVAMSARSAKQAHTERGRAAAHLRWASDLLLWVDTQIAAETATDAARAARAGLDPVPDVDPPEIGPQTAAEARENLNTAVAAYEQARRRHDATHATARAAWAAALRTAVAAKIHEHALRDGFGSAGGVLDSQAEGMRFRDDIPRCPRHPQIALRPPGSREPGWCILCRRAHPVTSAARPIFPITGRDAGRTATPEVTGRMARLRQELAEGGTT